MFLGIPRAGRFLSRFYHIDPCGLPCDSWPKKVEEKVLRSASRRGYGLSGGPLSSPCRDSTPEISRGIDAWALDTIIIW